MPSILLVEDNRDNRDLVCALLEDFYAVESCADAHEALARLNAAGRELPKVLLLDISLPGMDGIELLQRLRSDPRLCHIPAIALTAHAMKDDESRLRSMGFEAYLSKPIVDETRLVQAVDALLAVSGGGEK